MIISKATYQKQLEEATQKGYMRGFKAGFNVARKKAYKFISDEIAKAIERQKKIEG